MGDMTPRLSRLASQAAAHASSQLTDQDTIKLPLKLEQFANDLKYDGSGEQAAYRYGRPSVKVEE